MRFRRIIIRKRKTMINQHIDRTNVISCRLYRRDAALALLFPALAFELDMELLLPPFDDVC